MNLHTGQAALDRWRTEGRWVMFGEGARSHIVNRIGPDFGKWAVLPPAWMVEAAKPCETCDGTGRWPHFTDSNRWSDDCPDCDGGRQRHTITVPCDGRCDSFTGAFRHSPECDGRITVPELAVVEWGPLVVYGVHDQRDDDGIIVGDTGVWRFDGEHHALTLPPNVDPQSLVGQYAIGGKLVTP